MNEPTVFIVDDDAAVRDSLSILLQGSGFNTKTYPSGEAFMAGFDPAETGCLLLDVNMPKMNGLDLLLELRERKMTIPVIMITAYGDVPTAVRAMQLGAVDFVEKPYKEEYITDKIRSILAEIIDRSTLEEAIRDFRELYASLTNREKEVFGELLTGSQNKTIARQLAISPRTVEIHRANIFEKMQVENLTQLVRMAVHADLS